MFNPPNNLVNVPAWMLEEEQVTRAIRRTDRSISAMFNAINQMAIKNFRRRQELDRQRARRAKMGVA